MLQEINAFVVSIGQTLLKGLPMSIALGVVFAVLTFIWAAIQDRPGGASASLGPTSATGS